MNKEFWKNNYNTTLSKENENRFQKWAKEKSSELGRNVLNDLEDYDLRGYWINGGYKEKGAGHMPDTFKKPNHPSFSNESQYSGVPDAYGGTTKGGRWIGNDESGWSFEPSPRMLKTTHTKEQLQRYFAENEPDTTLVMPPKNAKE